MNSLVLNRKGDNAGYNPARRTERGPITSSKSSDRGMAPGPERRSPEGVQRADGPLALAAQAAGDRGRGPRFRRAAALFRTLGRGGRWCIASMRTWFYKMLAGAAALGGLVVLGTNSTIQSGKIGYCKKCDINGVARGGGRLSSWRCERCESPIKNI